jgi:transposase
MAGKQGQVHYSLDTKLEAIRLYEEEGLPQAEIVSRLRIRDPKRVKVWLHQYRQEGKAGLTKPIGRPKKKKEEDLEAEVKRLRMENDLLKKIQAELRKLERADRNIG